MFCNTTDATNGEELGPSTNPVRGGQSIAQLQTRAWCVCVGAGCGVVFCFWWSLWLAVIPDYELNYCPPWPLPSPTQRSPSLSLLLPDVSPGYCALSGAWEPDSRSVNVGMSKTRPVTPSSVLTQQCTFHRSQLPRYCVPHLHIPAHIPTLYPARFFIFIFF